MSSNIYEILLPLAFGHGFDYAAPGEISLRPGDYVRVPFGRRTLVGVVWGPGKGEVASEKIKFIEAHLAHLPPMPDAMRSFIDWVAWYTLSPRGNVLRMALFDDALEEPKQEARYRIASSVGESGKVSEASPQGVRGRSLSGESVSPIKSTPARLRILSYLSDGAARSSAEIQKYANVSAAVIKQFAEAGGLEKILQIEAVQKYEYRSPDFKFSSEQQRALDELKLILSAKAFSVALLDGVTGSGKTEVYFARIDEVIRRGEQVLVLLPEIGLSVQWLERFTERFGAPPHLWHSGVSQAKKRGTWQAVADGTAHVVVGARSALFLPFRNLSLIVVDEEHDHSYKQEDGVMYQARDMAVVRGMKEKTPVMFVSATPSLETVANVEAKKYRAVHLHERFAEASLPSIETVDMRQEKLPSGQFISGVLKDRIIKTLGSGGQAMLFINRRGYAPLVLCKSCGHRFCCPNCSSWLVMHKKRGAAAQVMKNEAGTQLSLVGNEGRETLPNYQLLCHHCGYHAPPPSACPSCSANESFTAYGPGVERIAEEVRTLLPNARIGTMTSDLIESPKELAALIKNMEEGNLDILIGTQMISKGYHFARLALVGVVDADMGLSGGDLRAGERTYQLLHQLSGRAGREKLTGSVLLQSYMPDHPVMQALVKGDRDMFMQLESEMRKAASMPPFGRLAALIIEGNDEAKVQEACRALSRHIPPDTRYHEALVLGPAPAPLARLRGRTRYRFLIKTPREFPLQEYINNWLNINNIPQSIKLKTDIDPYSFW